MRGQDTAGTSRATAQKRDGPQVGGGYGGDFLAAGAELQLASDLVLRAKARIRRQRILTETTVMADGRRVTRSARLRRIERALGKLRSAFLASSSAGIYLDRCAAALGSDVAGCRERKVAFNTYVVVDGPIVYRTRAK